VIGVRISPTDAFGDGIAKSKVVRTDASADSVIKISEVVLHPGL